MKITNKKVADNIPCAGTSLLLRINRKNGTILISTHKLIT